MDESHIPLCVRVSTWTGVGIEQANLERGGCSSRKSDAFPNVNLCDILAVIRNQVLDTTHKHIPAKTIVMPNAVSFVINFPSANHSPSTVKRKASEFVIGTVNESSV